MRRGVAAVGLLLGVAAAAAFAWHAAKAWPAVDWAAHATPGAGLGLAIAVAAYAAATGPAAWGWQRLLGASGADRPLGMLARILALTQMAKYLPGNVGAPLGRAAMAVAEGIPARPVAQSLVWETVLGAGAAVGLGVACLWLAGDPARLLASIPPWGWGLAAGAAGALLAVAWRRAGRQVGLSWSVLMAVPGAYAVGYLAIGAGLWAMAVLLLPQAAHTPLGFVAAFTLSWVAGFLAPGAPAGLGVREAALLALLSGFYPAADALLLTLAFRVVTLLGDAAVFGMGVAGQVRARRALLLSSGGDR